MNRNEVKKEKIKVYLFWLINILIWTALYWSQSVRYNEGDYHAHNFLANALFEERYVLMYPGYHILVGGLAKLLGIRAVESCVLILTMAACASIYVTRMIFQEILGKNEKNIKLLWMAFLVNIVQPIFTYTIRPGYSSGNGYRSPTQAICIISNIALL